jgi:hypothetical protein
LQFADRKLDALEDKVLAALRVGAYQIFFMRLPHHAAVAETVEALKSLGLQRAAGFCNAILRKLAALESPPLPPREPLAPHLALRESHPGVTIDVDVDLTAHLARRLSAAQLDLVCGIDGMLLGPLTKEIIGSFELAWMASPILGVPRSRVTPEILAGFPIVGHTGGHHQAMIARWFRDAGHPPRWIDFVWLSFSTLTTAGYGDLAPISPWANSLCTLEALCGILFPATLIARIASLPGPTTVTGPPSSRPL